MSKLYRMHTATDELLLDRYKIISKLGSGGFADVYEAFDTRMERAVAIKQVRVDRHSAPRVLREARTVAHLNHPNIVTLYEFEDDGDDYYLIMERIEGVSLARLLSRLAPLPIDEALAVAIQICRALEAAHEHGIVHRDIKPENVMILPDGRLKVMDFGIATLTGTATTTSGDIVGTFAYMSPEQARGEPVDARSDIFSLGTVLYEMLTDALPFHGESALQTLAMVKDGVPGAPSELRPELDIAIDVCVLRALEKDPALRFATATELRRALEGCREADEPVDTVLAGLFERYGFRDEGLAPYEDAGWRTRLWSVLDDYAEAIRRTAAALILAGPFVPVLAGWFSLPRSLAVVAATMLFLFVLLQPAHGTTVALLLLTVSTAWHSVGLFLILFALLVPYWALIARYRPHLAVWPALGAAFGAAHVPFVFPVLAGLLAGPLAAAFIGATGCVAFEVAVGFLPAGVPGVAGVGADLWAQLRGEANPVVALQLLTAPGIENPLLLVQPLLWAVVAAFASLVRGRGRWVAATVAGSVALILGYQAIAINFEAWGFDAGELMQALSFSLIILLLLPIVRPPARVGDEGEDEPS